MTLRHTKQTFGAVAWATLIALVAALTNYPELWPWAVEYPRDAIVPLREWINGSVKWLINDLSFGLFSFKELTRGISWLLGQPMLFAKGLLVTGYEFDIGGLGIRIPSISWVAIVGIAALMGHFARNWKLAGLLGILFLYLVVFGHWESAMLTVSSILVAVPLGAAGGLLLGLFAYRSRRFELVLRPLLDLMQTVPAFAYLVLVVTFFGFGPIAAVVATVIFAMPPMVRVTTLALKQVDEGIVEFAHMAGCSRRQLTWKVIIPAALPGLMIGVNQVIMLSFSMVIIASMIGAGGLGYDVLRALKSLEIGKGFEAGIAITFLAIALDRFGQALATRSSHTHRPVARSIILRYPHLALALVLVVGATAASALVPVLELYPGTFTLTTGDLWDRLVSWINLNLYDVISTIKSAIVVNVMMPFKRFLLSLPWLGIVLLLGFAAYRLAGFRLAALVIALATFIAAVGLWEKSILTVYLTGISAFFAASMGIPIGIYGAVNDRAHRVISVVTDFLQTLPAFVYLIPVVMLFAIGDFSAMIAVVVFAVAPAIRYTDHAIRRVSPDFVEAARAAGSTRRQILWKVELPLALPGIMLGINQTIMMAISMLIITALIGTRDLGQETLLAMNKGDAGLGISAGLCVAFIAIISDRLIAAWVIRRKKTLGLPV